MGTRTTQETKHNWTLERMRGRRCALRDSYHSTGHWCEKTHYCVHSTDSRAGLCIQSSQGGAPFTLQTGSFVSRGAPTEKKLPPLTQPDICKGREAELDAWKKPAVFPAEEQSVTVYNVQGTTGSQRSFEALGSTY